MDLFGIAHVKLEFILVLKINTIPILGIFIWSTNFVHCEPSTELFCLQILNLEIGLLLNVRMWTVFESELYYSDISISRLDGMLSENPLD